MIRNFLPLGSYSKPLARKIGLEASVLLFELLEDHGNNLFSIDVNYCRNLGIETLTWSLEKLTKFNLIKKNGDYYQINKDELKIILEEDNFIKPKSHSKIYLECCSRWVKFLKDKKGVAKDIGAFLLEMDGKAEEDVIVSINRSISNGWKTLFFNDKDKNEVKPATKKGGWAL